MNVNDITSFDYLIAFILLLFLIRGVWIGFVRQLAALAALIGSYWLAGRYVGLIIPKAQQFIEQPGVIFLASFAVLFLSATLLITLTGNLLHRFMEANLLGWFNRFIGGLLGLIRGAAVTVLLYMILASALSHSHHLFLNSLTAPHLSRGAEIIRQFILDIKAREDLWPEKGRKAEEAPPAPDSAGDRIRI